jgi:hypothetical protein
MALKSLEAVVRHASEKKVRYEFQGPLWLLDGLKQLARRERKPMAALVQAALLAHYPELREMEGGFVSRVLGRARARTQRAAEPAVPQIVQPGGSVEQGEDK